MRERLQKMEKATKVRDNIHLLKSPEFPSSNSVVILDKDTVLIDTGVSADTLEKIKEDVDVVINTHYHYDHIKNDGLFDEVRISNIETPALNGPESYLMMCGVADPEVEEDLLSEIGEGFKTEKTWPEKVVPFSIEDTFDFGETRWEVIHTPGHSPGHCCFYERDLDVLIGGDYGPEEFGPWYGWPSCDLVYLVDSIEKIIDLDPGMLFSGHADPVVDDVASVMGDYLDVVIERDEEILSLFDEGKSVEGIMDEDIFYSEDAKSSGIIRYFAEIMISKHLKADF